MTDNEAITALVSGWPVSCTAAQYPRLRCALKVFADCMRRRGMGKRAWDAEDEIIRLDAQFQYDDKRLQQRGF